MAVTLKRALADVEASARELERAEKRVRALRRTRDRRVARALTLGAGPTALARMIGTARSYVYEIRAAAAAPAPVAPAEAPTVEVLHALHGSVDAGGAQ